MPKISAVKSKELEAYLRGNDSDEEQCEKTWRKLDAKQRMALQRNLMLGFLRGFYSQLSLIQEKMEKGILSGSISSSTPAGVIRNLTVGQGVLVDKIADIEKQLSDLEAKLGTSAKTRAKNSVKVAK